MQAVAAIPSDTEISAMTPEALASLGDRLARSGDEAAVEAFKSALLRIHQGWRSGAHSENPATKWNRKHRRHDQLRPALVGNAIDDYIEAQDIVVATAVGLSKREWLIWHYVDQEGVAQDRIAAALGISVRTVGRILLKAREELKWMVDSNVRRVFRLESHRSAYFPPGYRPELPPGVEEARERMEATPEITTHVMPDDFGLVEEWRKGERQFDDSVPPKPIGKRVCTLKAKVRIDRRKRKVRARLKKVYAQNEKSSV